MLPIERQEFTIRKWPLYFIAAVFLLMLYILNDKGKIDGAAYFAMGGLFLFLVIYYMLSKCKFIIDDAGITQELFFGKKRELKWNEIVSSNLNWQYYHGHGASLSWDFCGHFRKKISIKTSMYSRKKLRSIAVALIEKSKQAYIDKRIQNVAEGKFPWYIF